MSLILEVYNFLRQVLFVIYAYSHGVHAILPFLVHEGKLIST